MTPGESERAEHDLRLADQALRVARLALEDGALEDTASRLYYAAFHAATAALDVAGRHAKTHSGLIGLFVQTYGDTGPLNELLEMRGAADYEPLRFRWDRSRLESMLSAAHGFIERCRSIVEAAIAKGPDEPDPPPDI